MAKPKTGKGAADIFNNTGMEPADAPTKRGRGREGFAEKYSKTTIPLFPGQRFFLDDTANHAALDRGVPIARAGLIRALIDGLQESGVDIIAALPDPPDPKTERWAERGLTARIAAALRAGWDTEN